MSRLAAAIVIIVAGAGGVAAGERPFVSDASPYVRDGVVVCDVRSGGHRQRRFHHAAEHDLHAMGPGDMNHA